MKKHITSILGILALFSAQSARADLSTNLVAYYDFQQAGTLGLANKAPGATGGNLTWGIGGANSTTGFTGNAAFTAVDGTSNRGTLLAGNSLNLVDADNAYVVSPYGSADLGTSFTIAMWTYLAPGSTNASPRFHALESKDIDIWDVSWGTTPTVSSTGYDDYLAFVETTKTAEINNLTKETWQHVLLAYDLSGSNPTLSVYVNGSTTAITATDTNGGAFSFTGLNIGRARDGTTTDRDWDGMIDEVAIWNRALNQTERTEVYQLGLGGAPIASSGIVVSVSSANLLQGTVSGGGVYGLGTEVPVSATAKSGYVFAGWTGDFSAQPASFVYTANTSATATATFGEDSADPDHDNLTNYEEIVIYNTNPNVADSDHDQIPDGDEVNITATDPNHDDSALVSFVANNLGSGTAGGIALSTPTITRNPSTGVVTLSMSLSGSSDRSTWQPIDLNGAGVSLVPSADGWDLTVPAPSSSVNSYILMGSQP